MIHQFHVAQVEMFNLAQVISMLVAPATQLELDSHSAGDHGADRAEHQGAQLALAWSQGAYLPDTCSGPSTSLLLK